MEQLIKITESNGKKAVSARELFNFLEVITPFNKWIKRMLAYGFNENVDWTKMSLENQIVVMTNIKNYDNTRNNYSRINNTLSCAF